MFWEPRRVARSRRPTGRSNLLRKIRASTLARLLARYAELHPEDFRDGIADIETPEAAEVLGLLPARRQWGLLRGLEPERAAALLVEFGDKALAAALAEADPPSRAAILERAGADLRERVAKLERDPSDEPVL